MEMAVSPDFRLSESPNTAVCLMPEASTSITARSVIRSLPKTVAFFRSPPDMTTS
ncbi:hypothetical protein D3C75_597750 [compost metagenome]